MNRRNFITNSLALPLSFYITRNMTASEINIKTDKAVIFLFLGGGISNVEFSNPKINVPEEYASINGAISTQSDYQLGGNFTNLAKVSKHITPVHNYKTFDADHQNATYYSLTGMPAFGISQGGAQKEPSYGSMISTAIGERGTTGLPNYVKINKINGDGPAWLGVKHSGFATDEDGIKNLQINSTPEQFIRRNKMVNEIEAKNGRIDHYFKEWSNLRNAAKEVVMGKAAQAFNLKNEDEVWLKRYEVDKNGFGKNCLLARRMIEAGSKFVSLSHDGWDMHSSISKGFDNRSVDLDLHLYNLILDLESKGMINNTLIVVTSEFSRTKLNNGSGGDIVKGRDHNPNITSLLLVGGKYGDSIIGESDKFGLEAQGNPFSPKDLSYTILNWLDISQDKVVIDDLKRPRHLVQSEARIIV